MVYKITLSAAVLCYGNAQSPLYQDMQMLGTRHGLSSLKINNTIVQDNQGFIWVGTEDGLNKFDGYGFTVYKNIRQDSTSIINNIITALYIDSRGRLCGGFHVRASVL